MQDWIPTNRGDIPFYRASGDKICTCGRKYYDHPMDEKVLDYAGQPFLHILCNGDRVKL